MARSVKNMKSSVSDGSTASQNDERENKCVKIGDETICLEY